MTNKLKRLLSSSSSQIFISYTIIFILVASVVSISAETYSRKLSSEIIVSVEKDYLKIISSTLVVPILSNSSTLVQSSIDMFMNAEDTRAIYVKYSGFTIKSGDTSQIENKFNLKHESTELVIKKEKEGEWLFSTPIYDTLAEDQEILGSLYVHIISPEVGIMSSRIKSFVIVATSAGGLVLWALLYLVILRITKPLKTLVASMKHYSKDTKTISAPDHCPSDVKMVYTSFNNMILQIRNNEHEILSNNENLERTVKERTVTLKNSNEQLENARDEAVEASKAKDTFVANVSHEIRTPIQAIISSADILSSKYTDGELNIISSSANHLISVINNILDLSKINSDAIELNKTQFNACTVISNIANSLFIQSNTKGNRATYNRGKLPKPEDNIVNMINTDSTVFRQILFNLVSNAVKFTRNGIIDISINTIDINNVPFYEFNITDTGIGISEDMIERIFEPFVQSDMTRKRTDTGVGLGLSISKRLAEVLGGSLTVKSTLGKGAAFKLTIPVGDIDQIEATENTTNESLSVNPVDILFAEDHAFIRDTLIKILSKEGHNVYGVDNGQSLIEQLETENNYELLFVDVHMPEKDGIEAIKEAHKKGLLGNKKVVFLTADVTSPIIEQAENLGASLMTKPVSRKQILDVIASLQPVKQSYIADDQL